MESRNSSPNPYYNQTSQWFFLCFSYGNPCSIYTPWWKRDIRWSIWSNWWHIDYSSLLESLWAKVYTKEINNSEWSFWPVYMITKINNKSLPQPVEKTRAEYLSYDDSQNSWETLDKVFLKKQREEMSRVETQNIVDIESLSSILDQYENSSDSLSEWLIRQRDEILEQIVIGQRLSFVPWYSTNKDWSKIQFISISQYPIDERFWSWNSKRLWEINYDTKKWFFSSEIETDNEEIKLVIRYIKICLKKFKSSYASQYTWSKEIVDRKVYVLFDAEKKIDF